MTPPSDPTTTIQRTAAGVVNGVKDLLDPGALAARIDPVAFGGALGEVAKGLLTRPLPVARRTAGLAAGSGRATLTALARSLGGHGAGPAALPEKDRRYADPAWEGNAYYYLLRQQHALFAEYLEAVASGVELSPVARRKIDFLVRQTVDATSPVNWPWSNPTMVKKAFETGGQSLFRGTRNMLRDSVSGGGMPRQITPGEFEVGKDLAATPGVVVHRNRLMELIQYKPQTEQVHEVPLLLSPPWINKYYIMDLAPRKSLVEWAVQHGHTVFVISYRNPDESMRDVVMADYMQDGPLAALDVIRDVTGAEKVNVAALCLGGTLAAATAAWLAARGDQRINSITLMNTLLDFSEPGQLGVFTDEKTVDRLERTMRRTGYLPATSMKSTFDLLRATDLVWNYVINDWLLGEEPAAFDMLAWNADSTRMPAAMQTEYLRNLYLDNQLVEGKMELAGERLDLGAVTQDAYVVSAEADHIAPWRSVYKGLRHLGGTTRFVLSNSGHIAGVVNPPSPKSKHWFGEAAELPASADDWRDDAGEHKASWWEDWTPWIGERAGEMTDPPRLGSDAHPVLMAAPGSYVLGT
ncbi:PHA/PHB synthase family protein [Pseudonocardia hydrocarbonoxydans]|uniref:Class I poly(R)-hydroxyalkanoic acid synthase n=1 Tax=Pseudonocardia hydrocarbonoxydans TaxID=76726 RepID=A0A4Y3WHH2_9PSEU|nr:alpha/beta fold hydrolase [Pseudonocardia hydrocarbonoxydans]GEC18387.1 class I poly(R)-hydroxyalkanoic acid synthase [Pseudonocardia hydrocarbonoxydans]